MERREFLQLADRCLAQVSAWLEQFDPDEVDFAASDGVLTMEYADRSRFVLNRQTAADQMWFAAGARAWHYDWDGASQSWRCAKDGHELYQRLAEVVSEKLGREVRL